MTSDTGGEGGRYKRSDIGHTLSSNSTIDVGGNTEEAV